MSNSAPRFFENFDAFADHVLAGKSIDTGIGAMDGDHPSWLMQAMTPNEDEPQSLDLVQLAYLFSSRVRTPEQAQNIVAYVNDLFRSTLAFNISEGGADESGMTEEEMDAIQSAL